MTKLKLSNPAYLAAASLVASTDETRYYLQGVHIESAPEGGVFLVATNSHAMSVFWDRDGNVDAPVTLPVSRALFAATKYAPKYQSRRLEVSDNIIRVWNGVDPPPSYMQHFSQTEGEFPNWRRVIPKLKKKRTSPAFNSSYLAAFDKTLIAAFGAYPFNEIRLICSGEKGPVLVRTGSTDWFGVLMPVISQTSSELPFSIEAKTTEK